MISVIINVYNGEKYIRKCLDCITNQTYKNLEILVINDGSTDKTLDICKRYKDKRVRIITTENKGLALSRNIGIDNAKGEYLYFIDVDDLIELDTLEYLYNLCIKYNTRISTCKSFDIRNNNYYIKNDREELEILSSKDMLKKIFLAEDNAVAIWNKLIKKELFENLRFEKRLSDDILFTHKLIMKTEKIVYSNQYKYYYVKHEESICTKKKEDYNWNVDMYNAFLERYKYVKKTHPNFLENDIGILLIIEKLYLRKNKKIIKFLNEQHATKKYNNLFSLRLLKCNFGTREKIKLILFRISPKLHNNIVNTYLKIMRKNK